MFFKLNCKYYLYILFQKDTNLCLKSKLVTKLANKLKNMVLIY